MGSARCYPPLSVLLWYLPLQFLYPEGDSLRLRALHRLHHQPIATGKIGLLGVTQTSCALANAMGFSVVHRENPLPPAEVFARLPEWERGRFHPNWDDLAFRVGTKVNAMEF